MKQSKPLFMAYRAADPCDRIILHSAKIVDNQFQYIPKKYTFSETLQSQQLKQDWEVTDYRQTMVIKTIKFR